MYLVVLAFSIIFCALFLICIFACRQEDTPVPVSIAVEIGSVNSSEVTIYDLET